MARQHFTKFVINPDDDFMHPDEGKPNYNESMYFNLIDPRQRIGGWFRLGNRVNEGHAEMSCCVYLPDGRVAFMHDKPKIADNKSFNAGGMRFQVVEPFRRLTLGYQGKLYVMERPHEMADPSHAFKNNPVEDAGISLDFTGISPMHGGIRVLANGSPLPDVAGFAKGHTEQHMSGSGTVRIGGSTWKIEGFGLRDHSWGPRHWSNIHWYRWLPMNFGGDFGAMVSVVKLGAGPKVATGMVLENGIYQRIGQARVLPEWDSSFYQTSLKVWVRTDDDREYEMEGRVLSLIPLRHRRTAPDGTKYLTRITEGLTEYRCREVTPGVSAPAERSGFGISEFLDQIDEDGTPVGFRDKQGEEKIAGF
ncbi:MAG: hypothetical protein KIT79_10815 [Deltaproteobacteria bacterium]|nr:hypothetical protein [Deltaproteobacteria bacterium]